MHGTEREHPIDCSIGDYIVIHDVDGAFGQEGSPGVFRVSVDGPTGLKWTFQRWAEDGVTDADAYRWQRIE